jgi:hypothetical protein
VVEGCKKRSFRGLTGGTTANRRRHLRFNRRENGGIVVIHSVHFPFAGYYCLPLTQQETYYANCVQIFIGPSETPSAKMLEGVWQYF